MNLTSPIDSVPIRHRVPRSILQRLEDAKTQPVIARLVGDFLFSGELHILFADTGIGKSILACQIADCITKGRPVLGMRGSTVPLCTLIMDFELSDRQLEARYRDSTNGTCHDFHESFHSDGIDFLELGNEYPGLRLDQAILQRIRTDVASTGAQLLIIDNISYLSMQTAQDTQVAMELMKSLVDLKKELGITILVLAHTPKIPGSRPISINDLAGSKHLANFADSVSGLGRSSKGADVVYWKQVKASRSGEFIYDADNVLVLHRCRITPSFLGFEVRGTESEYGHLRQSDPDERIQLRKQAVDMHSRGIGLTEIAKKLLGDPGKKSTIFNWVTKAQSSGSRITESPIPFNDDDGNDVSHLDKFD